LLHVLPISSSLIWSFWLYLAKSTSYEVLIMHFPPAFYYFMSLSPDVLSTVFLDICRPCSSLDIRDSVSHPYKTTRKIVSSFVGFNFNVFRQQTKHVLTDA
jgi:hypothetical protein